MQKGTDAYNKFCKDRLNVLSLSLNFYDKLPRQNLKTFSNLSKKQRKVTLKGNDAILRADRYVFGQMIICAENRRLHMKDVLSHPLGPIPWALATPEGAKHKTSTSSLGK